MKTPLIILAAVLLLMAGGLYYQFLYPPSVLKNNTEAALVEFADAVETQDRTQVLAALDRLLTDDAKVRLDVSFSTIASGVDPRPMVQEFSKASFITFIDNLLFTLNDYHYHPKLMEFLLGDDRAAAAVQFRSSQAADGPSYYLGSSVMMRFSSDATCRGEVAFEERKPRLKQAACEVLLRSVPKAGGAEGLKNAKELRDLLKQQ